MKFTLRNILAVSIWLCVALAMSRVSFFYFYKGQPDLPTLPDYVLHFCCVPLVYHLLIERDLRAIVCAGAVPPWLLEFTFQFAELYGSEIRYTDEFFIITKYLDALAIGCMVVLIYQLSSRQQSWSLWVVLGLISESVCLVFAIVILSNILPVVMHRMLDLG